jgi:putative oxidoreductase
MKIANKIRNWGDRHHPKILDVLRMALGLFLLFKGIVFLNNAAYLRYLIIENGAIRQSPEIITALIYYVTYIHVVGGALIFLGLYTRLWAILQFPVVFGAVFFVNITAPYINSELWLSILVLILLFLFIIIGSGPLSLDSLLSRNKPDDDERPSLKM